MIGRPKKKLMWCAGCAAERMCYAKGARYECRRCGAAVDAFLAARTASRERQAARAERRGAPPPDPAFIAWVAARPCLRCGAPPPSHAHHTVHRSQGGSDRTCAPLCVACHGEYHGQLGSVAAARAAWGLDLYSEAAALSDEFDGAGALPL